ncbi:MAG: nucleoside kinase [Oscillospiraceae bacterium]|nr:nucleoside kinase [Oscillospiraceae bacterium]
MRNSLFSKDGVVTLDVVNDFAKNNPKELILLCEEYYQNQVDTAVSNVINKNGADIVLLAGPSGSGKTTTAKKLSEGFIKNGKHAVYISLDDFFVNREDLPKLANGKTDFESVNTLDIKEIRNCFLNLLSGKEAVVPSFDFVSGKRDVNKAQKIKIEKNDIVIVEGLHALNPQLTDGISLDNSGFYKLFVNPESQISLVGGKPVLKRRSLRLMRRMIRDYYFRGSTPSNTLNMWQGVCDEENKSIIPFKSTADFLIDTAHFYEPCVYHNYLLPIINKEKAENKHHEEILNSLAEKLELFYDLEMTIIPKNSMIREFVGKA